jgi:hypothetical protein
MIFLVYTSLCMERCACVHHAMCSSAFPGIWGACVALCLCLPPVCFLALMAGLRASSLEMRVTPMRGYIGVEGLPLFGCSRLTPQQDRFLSVCIALPVSKNQQVQSTFDADGRVKSGPGPLFLEFLRERWASHPFHCSPPV